jgi:hypothetical protein
MSERDEGRDGPRGARIAGYTCEFDARPARRAAHVVDAARSYDIYPTRSWRSAKLPRLCRPTDGNPLTRQAVHPGGRHNPEVGTIGVVRRRHNADYVRLWLLREFAATRPYVHSIHAESGASRKRVLY